MKNLPSNLKTGTAMMSIYIMYYTSTKIYILIPVFCPFFFNLSMKIVLIFHEINIEHKYF